MSKTEHINLASAPRRKRRSPWRRVPLQGIVLLLAGIFVLTYPVYTYLDDSITGGIHQRGDLLVVDLKSMSSFDMDQDIGTTADIPQKYRDLDGKRVMLTGEMYTPYAAVGKVNRFTLVYSITQCCFNGPPKVQHLVEATMVAGRDSELMTDPVAVVGVLHVGVQQKEGHIVSVYRMDVDRVQRD